MEEPTMKTELLNAVLQVGHGRGFVVHGKHDRLVITAAHCLPELPPAHPASYNHERTWKLLALLGEKPAVLTECLFVDPIVDVAVLGSPDNQQLFDEARAYDELVGSVRPFHIGRARPRVDVLVLTLDSRWTKLTVERNGHWLWSGPGFEPGMSGSPIVSLDGHAIGVVSTGGMNPMNPVLTEALPGRFRLARGRIGPARA
jgi:hypothetical protein